MNDAEMLKRESVLLERAANSLSSAGFVDEPSEHRERAEALMSLAARLPELERKAKAWDQHWENMYALQKIGYGCVTVEQPK